MGSSLAKAPTPRIRWYPQGHTCTDPTPASILLVDHGTDTDKAIGFGERVTALRHPELKPYAWCRHNGLVRLDEGAGPMVSEMGPRGRELHSLLTYDARLYAVVDFPSVTSAQIAAALSVDESFASADYGWLAYSALAVDGFTGLSLGISIGRAVICSTHVSMCALALGLVPDRAPSCVTPMHNAWYLGAEPPK